MKQIIYALKQDVSRRSTEIPAKSIVIIVGIFGIGATDRLLVAIITGILR
jgi:hypothetical protein